MPNPDDLERRTMLEVIVSLIGIVLGLVVFWPRMTVEAKSEIDSAEPRAISLKITNTGLIQLRDLQPTFGLCELSIGDAPAITNDCNGPLMTRLAPTFW